MNYIIIFIIAVIVNICYSVLIKTKNEYWSNDVKVINSLYQLPECCHGGKHWVPYKGCSIELIPERYIGPCSSLTNNITLNDYYELLKNTSRNIIIVGDSLSRQWFESLVCYLKLNWNGFNNNENTKEKLLSSLKTIPFLSDGKTFGYAKIEIGKSCIFYYNIAHMSLDSIKNIILYHNNVSNVEYGYRIIINYKAIHFRDKDKDLETFRYGLRQLVSYCIQNNANCVLLEASAQHFVNPKYQNIFHHGLFNKSYDRKCYNKTYLEYYDSLARWRNEAIWSERQSLNVIPYFDALISRPSSHHFQREQTEDCTHIVFNMKYWEPLHLGLLMNLKNFSCYSTFQNSITESMLYVGQGIKLVS